MYLKQEMHRNEIGKLCSERGKYRKELGNYPKIVLQVQHLHSSFVKTFYARSGGGHIKHMLCPRHLSPI